ncbi:MAG: hypothetical protein HQL11_05720, partial [Candidatus Omnitrophica bacterium]|nr:hypothetical protein [Candidatus Omnitrophota bacterium]
DAVFDQQKYLETGNAGRPRSIVSFRRRNSGMQLTSLLKTLPNVHLKIILGATDDGRSWRYGSREFRATGVAGAGKALIDLSRDVRVRDFLSGRFRGMGRTEDELAQDVNLLVARLQNPQEDRHELSQEMRAHYQRAMRMDTGKRRVLVRYLQNFCDLLTEHRKQFPESRFSFRSVPLRSLVLLGGRHYFENRRDGTPSETPWQEAIDSVGRLLNLKEGHEVVFPTEARQHLVGVREDGTVYFSEFSLTEYNSSSPFLGLWLVNQAVDDGFIREVEYKLRESFGIEFSSPQLDGSNISFPVNTEELRWGIRQVEPSQARKVAELFSAEYATTEAANGRTISASPRVREILTGADAILFSNDHLETNAGGSLIIPGVREAIRDNRRAVKISLDQALHAPSHPGEVLDRLDRFYRYLTRQTRLYAENHDWAGVADYVHYVLTGLPEDKNAPELRDALSPVEEATRGRVGGIGVDAGMSARYGFYSSNVLADAMISLMGLRDAGYRVNHLGRLMKTRSGEEREAPDRSENGLFRENPAIRSMISSMIRDRSSIFERGAFLFDVDMTLLPKGAIAVTQYEELSYMLMRLLREGFRVGIISGSSEYEQMRRILAAIKDQMKDDVASLNNLTFYVNGGATKIRLDRLGRVRRQRHFNERHAMPAAALEEAICAALLTMAKAKFVGADDPKRVAEFVARNQEKFNTMKLDAPWMRGKRWKPEILTPEEVQVRIAKGKPVSWPWIERRGWMAESGRVASISVRGMQEMNWQGAALDVRGRFQDLVREELRKNDHDPDEYNIRSGGSSTTDITHRGADKVAAVRDYLKGDASGALDPRWVYYFGDEFFERGDEHGHQIGNDEVLARDAALAEMRTLAVNNRDMQGADPKTLWIGRSPQATMEFLESILIQSGEYGSRLPVSPAGETQAGKFAAELVAAFGWAALENRRFALGLEDHGTSLEETSFVTVALSGALTDRRYRIDGMPDGRTVPDRDNYRDRAKDADGEGASLAGASLAWSLADAREVAPELSLADRPLLVKWYPDTAEDADPEVLEAMWEDRLVRFARHLSQRTVVQIMCEDPAVLVRIQELVSRTTRPDLFAVGGSGIPRGFGKDEANRAHVLSQSRLRSLTASGELPEPSSRDRYVVTEDAETDGRFGVAPNRFLAAYIDRAGRVDLDPESQELERFFDLFATATERRNLSAARDLRTVADALIRPEKAVHFALPPAVRVDAGMLLRIYRMAERVMSRSA